MRVTLVLLTACVLAFSCGRVTTFPDGASDVVPAGVTATPDAPAAPEAQLLTSGIPCQISIAGDTWNDICPSLNNGWCNSPDIDAALHQVPRPAVTLAGTCEINCYEKGSFTTRVSAVCQDGRVCQLTIVASNQRRPLCMN